MKKKNDIRERCILEYRYSYSKVTKKGEKQIDRQADKGREVDRDRA